MTNWKFGEANTPLKSGIILGRNQVGRGGYIKIGFDDDVLVDVPITQEQVDKFDKFMAEMVENIKKTEMERIVRHFIN